MRRVIIESPYAGDIELNTRYLRAAMADSLARGEAPYASHGLYTQPGVLRDDVPEERKKGIEAGYAWAEVADAIAFYIDLGMSDGMQKARRMYGAVMPYMSLEERSLPEWVSPAPIEMQPLPWSAGDKHRWERKAYGYISMSGEQPREIIACIVCGATRIGEPIIRYTGVAGGAYIVWDRRDECPGPPRTQSETTG